MKFSICVDLVTFNSNFKLISKFIMHVSVLHVALRKLQDAQ